MAQVQIIEQRAGYWHRDERGEWPVETEFYVYAGERLVRVCPSRSMAEEVAAGVAA